MKKEFLKKLGIEIAFILCFGIAIFIMQCSSFNATFLCKTMGVYIGNDYLYSLIFYWIPLLLPLIVLSISYLTKIA